MEKIIEEHFAAYNRFDTDAIMATYAPDALVYDVNREFWGVGAIRAWIAKEIVGERVTIEVTEVREQHGTTIVRGRYDGTYDKSKLPPGDLILTNYVRVRDGKIVEMYIVHLA
jgi:ketosteroid isomerase-like protein